MKGAVVENLTFDDLSDADTSLESAVATANGGVESSINISVHVLLAGFVSICNGSKTGKGGLTATPSYRACSRRRGYPCTPLSNCRKPLAADLMCGLGTA